MTDVNVHQVYAEVNTNTWMPVSLDFDMNFSGFGFKMKYKYVASISEYKTTLNHALDHAFLDKIKQEQLADQRIIEQINEAKSTPAGKPKPPIKQRKAIQELMQKDGLTNRESVKLNKLIEKEIQRNSPPEPLEIKSTFQVSQKQVNNDTAYWAKQRPIPLTLSESKSFVKKDSFLRISSTPRYKDSVRDSRQKFKARHLLFGKTYNYSVDSIRQNEMFTIPNLVNPNAFSFNTVDGLRMELPFSYYKADTSGHTLRLNSNFGYAFARQKLDATFSYSQRFRGLKNTWLTVTVGTTTEDFNRNSGISTMTNEFYTLFLEENYKKFYRRDYLQVMFSRDLINGLNWTEVVEYNYNRALTNHSTFTFFDNKDKGYTSNTPVNSTLEPLQTSDHGSFIFRLNLDYTPHNRYRIRDNRKMYAGSKYPTFSLGYRSALSWFAADDARFDMLKVGIRQKIDYGFDNHFSYQVGAGKFLNNNRLYFEDFQHFNIQSTALLFSSTENSFRLLPFYQYSTGKQYAEAHLNFQTYKLILKQLPLIKKTAMSENLYVNYLTTPEIKNYLEVGYGFSNLFLFLNAEVMAGFENGAYRSWGFKVSLNIK